MDFKGKYIMFGWGSQKRLHGESPICSVFLKMGRMATHGVGRKAHKTGEACPEAGGKEDKGHIWKYL